MKTYLINWMSFNVKKTVFQLYL